MTKQHAVPLAAASIAAAFFAPTSRAGLATQLGVTHIDGQYYFSNNKDYVSEGADTVLSTGTRAIKLEFTYQYKTKYDWNYAWPNGITSVTQLAQQAPFVSAFNKPFDTYVITTYGIGTGKGKDDTEYWLQGFDNNYASSTSNASLEKKQFHDLAAYLMNTYRGTGKTFILEQWEGDWALRDTNHDRSVQPTQTQVDNMVNWINARQAGISQARAEITNSDVKVYQALELNRPTDSIKQSLGVGSWLTVANDVLPRTNVDLASYSSYDSQSVTSGSLSFNACVNYIAGKLPSSAVFGRDLHSVGIGEFGIDENARGASGVNTAMNNVINTVVANQMPYAMWWEVYSNELKTGVTPPAVNNTDVNGFWLVKPDGTPSTAWHQYRQRLTSADATRATAAAIKTPLKPVYRNQFDAPGSTLNSSPWSTASTGNGAMSVSVSSGRVQMTVNNGTSFPYGLASLDIASALGRGLRPGEFLQFTMRRQNDTGFIGVDAFNTHHGSNSVAGNSPLQVYSSGWVPFSMGANGSTPTYDFDTTRTLGMRLDSADGTFASISYYLDGNYSGSWLYKTSQATLDSFGFFAQSNVLNSGFEFDNLAIYASAISGDANLDGKVDVTDLGQLATNWQQSAQWTGGDFNDDGFVDVSDLGLLATNWQAGSGSLSQALAVVGLANVPEPTTAIALLGTLFVAALPARPRRRF